ncbi:MAG: prepilin peptidase [Acidobacteria bacterium]|nr:prepilin peptidase [Acidobacteriota bacterium]
MIDAGIFAALTGLLGLIVGSFLNVCISRLPYDYSAVAPRSSCPHCGTMIAWYDNIPVVSFVVLGGQCRSCRAGISFRYPAVELLTGALFAYVAWNTGPGWETVKWCAFSAIVVELIFSDLETRILPDEFTKGGMMLGFLLSPIAMLPAGIVTWVTLLLHPGAKPALLSLLHSLGAAGLLSGGLWLVGELYSRLRGKEGLGFGDVKMVACLAAFLGLESTLLGLMAGSLLGAVIGLAYIKIRKLDTDTYELPFGSFLGLGALMAMATVIAG